MNFFPNSVWIYSFIFSCSLRVRVSWPRPVSLFPFFFSSLTVIQHELSQCVYLTVWLVLDISDSFLLTPFPLTHLYWLLIWLILTRTDSYWLIFPDYIWLILVQVLVVVADPSVYKNHKNLVTVPYLCLCLLPVNTTSLALSTVHCVNPLYSHPCLGLP